MMRTEEVKRRMAERHARFAMTCARCGAGVIFSLVLEGAKETVIGGLCPVCETAYSLTVSRKPEKTNLK
jgi:hypothetical protein